MHETFYIEKDEEITSIVEKLKRTKASEVFIVVPKSALLIQSIINLKLLKKEAQVRGKEILIVTQDKLGKMLVEKAGMTVSQKLSELHEDWDEAVGGEKEEFLPKGISERENINQEPLPRSSRGQIGSANFFEEETFVENSKEIAPVAPEERIINRELVTDMNRGILEKVSPKEKIFGTKSVDLIKNIDIRQGGATNLKSEPKNYFPDGLRRKEKSFNQKIYSGGSREEISRSELIDKASQFLASGEEKLTRPQLKKSEEEKASLPKNSGKFFLIFGGIVLGIISLVALYLFLPKASVKIITKTKNQSADLELSANAKSAQKESEVKSIPARIINVSEELSREFEATGEKSHTNKKAKGTITIYNEYGTQAQPLVATTRFLSQDGKLFRLVENVVVPGKRTEGMEVKPGAIEAEVVADEAGESFNIGPSSFTIPGFKGSGSDKYEKFYGKSFKTMTGGGESSEKARSVSEQDLASAKTEISQELQNKILDKIKSSTGEDAIVLEEAVSLNNPVFTSSHAAGELVEKFNLNLKEKGIAIVFNEAEVKKQALELLREKIGEKEEIIESSLKFEYGKADANFENEEMLIRIHVTGKISPKVDLEAIKKNILGKKVDQEELKKELSDYASEVSSLEVNFWPNLLPFNRIPAYESRVEMTLDNS